MEICSLILRTKCFHAARETKSPPQRTAVRLADLDNVSRAESPIQAAGSRQQASAPGTPNRQQASAPGTPNRRSQAQAVGSSRRWGTLPKNTARQGYVLLREFISMAGLNFCGSESFSPGKPFPAVCVCVCMRVRLHVPVYV